LFGKLFDNVRREILLHSLQELVNADLRAVPEVLLTEVKCLLIGDDIIRPKLILL
jgi:hypothetical protein